MFPVLALVELFAIRQQLQAVHLQTLNKVNLSSTFQFYIKGAAVIK
jgi:hypothetical protein